eukprot:5985808-Amphidinium_carterae.1
MTQCEKGFPPTLTDGSGDRYTDTNRRPLGSARSLLAGLVLVSFRESRMSDFNPAWIQRELSEFGREAANEYLDLWNAWSKTAVQGRPMAPIGVVAGNLQQTSQKRTLKWMENLSVHAHQTPFHRWTVDRDEERLDIWFERRSIREDGKPNGKNKDVMLTTFTAKRDADPYNGTDVVEPQTDQEETENTGSASAVAT